MLSVGGFGAEEEIIKYENTSVAWTQLIESINGRW
jgi:hypothetical protein